MKKRIYLNFLCLILLSALLLSASVSAVVYTAIRNREMDAIKDRAILAADLLNKATPSDGFIDFMNHDTNAARVTIISPDGTVLLDNKAVAATLENHADRDEFMQALQIGRGEATRYSSTLGAETYYYAIRLDDGNVLRVSKTMSRIVGIFIAVLPAIIGVTLLILLIANIVARRLTRNIIDPLSSIDFDTDNHNVYDELLPYVKKIDQQKREIAGQIIILKNRADTIEAITSNMREGLILINRDAYVLTANKSAADILSAIEMTGQNIHHICREMEIQQGIKECLSGVNAETQYERGGKTYDVFFSPVHDGDDITGGVILFLDISEKHDAERQRREFSANVSHELKTPLTTISALAEMIENGMAKECDIRAFAGKILMQSKRLINIIEDIIKLSEFDEGQMVVEHSSFNLYDLAQSVAGALQEQANEKHVSISIVGERFHVTANYQMIDELLYNLIDNAIKYNKDNGTVTVSLSKEDGLCKIAVADTGIGIPSEHHSHVFERFYRADKSRSKKTGGTGLGLSIVKHIAEHHGGQIALTSTEELGTTVDVILQNEG